MNHYKKLFFFAFLYFLATQSFGQIQLPQLIADSMVLQRDAPLKIWGWASKGEKVKVTFNGKSVSTTTANNGKWIMTLPAMKAGGPYKMQLEGKNKILIKGILIGDVWLCSGQSNMVHQMKLHAIRYADDIKNANYPEIRQFYVPTATNLNGVNQDLPKSLWKWANSENVKEFSAVAYFFARNLYRQHHIPIGIINSSVGGTPIEAWISEEGFKGFNEVEELIKQNKDTAYVSRRSKEVAAIHNTEGPDKGLSGDIKWFSPNYVPQNWRKMNIPGFWEDQGIKDLDGVVWFRKEIEIPAILAGKQALLFMGRIVDADVFYVNGKEVGSTSYQYPQRIYTIPTGVLKAEKNLFVVRVQNNSGKGGFVPDKPYYLEVGDEKIDLKGSWDYKVGQVNLPTQFTGKKGLIIAQNQPDGLYNAMIAPLTDYKLKGVLWYQGESNTSNANDYEKYLPALIHDWRNKFSNPDLPFYYVQLPGFGDYNYLPSESGMAVIREATLKTLSVPNTAMAITIDLGEWNDIHPDRKKEVGDRLALIARHFNYGEKKLEYSGPLYQSSEIEGNKIIIKFTRIGGGLIALDGEELSSFAIAGNDKKFVWGKAKIVGNTVEVSSDKIPEPKYVRYAWADNPVNPNLYNINRLPASPFSTDHQKTDLSIMNH